MATPILTGERIEELLQPYLAAPLAEERPGDASLGTRSRSLLDSSDLQKLQSYLGLLSRWNAKMNLTAIRSPEEIVRRHFGESLFLAGLISGGDALLDFGSGAGFPGIPIQLRHPSLKVTLAESQGKKATFLREVVRELSLHSAVWAGRVEEMHAPNFNTVVMRAVDRMEQAIITAAGLSPQHLWVLGPSSAEAVLAAQRGYVVRALFRCPGKHDVFAVHAERG